MKCCYDLTEKTYDGVIMYGISLFNSESGIIQNYESLSSDKDAVQKLIELCSESSVTDISMPYIIEDFIN